MSQQAVSVDIIQNSAVGISSTKQKELGYIDIEINILKDVSE
jgi:hypothetical protein